MSKRPPPARFVDRAAPRARRAAQPRPSRGAASKELEIVVTACPRGLKNPIIDAAGCTLLANGHGSGRLEVSVISEAEMRRQHARWLDDDTSTDVLTFDLRTRPRRGLVDGTLLVCGTVARRRARARRGDGRAELLLYVVHGCLHLCGMDDTNAAEARRMHAEEDRIMTELGWGPVFEHAARRKKK